MEEQAGFLFDAPARVRRNYVDLPSHLSALSAVGCCFVHGETRNDKQFIVVSPAFIYPKGPERPITHFM